MQDKETHAPEFPYLELVGALMCVMTCNQPDVSTALGEASKYCERYKKPHWMAAKQILKYLEAVMEWTMNFDLMVGTSKSSLDTLTQTGRVIWTQDALPWDMYLSQTPSDCHENRNVNQQ